MRQPWLSESTTDPAGDDFSRASVTRSAGRSATMLAIAVIVLLAGTATEFAKTLLDLPIMPGTDFAIDAMHRVAEALNTLGVTWPHERLREAARALEAARF
jgi:hypothetical protein